MTRGSECFLFTSRAEQRPIGQRHLQGLGQAVQDQLGEGVGLARRAVAMLVGLVQQAREVGGQRGQGLQLEECETAEQSLLVEDVGEQHQHL